MARMIDADKLITAIQGTASQVAMDAPYDPEWFTRLAARQFEILKMIDDAPTVDAVEVVHGRWEQVQRWATKAKYRCSVCGRKIMSATKVNIEKYPYCHCGAKMDGDGDE